MAVEIPVYVDISGAFDRAVREIPKEMTKLEDVVGRYTLNLNIDMGGGAFTKVRDLLTDTTMDVKDLEFALKRVRKAFDDAVAKGAKSKKTSGTVNGLAKAYGLLEQRIKGVYNANTVAAMRLEDNIAKVTYKIREMSSQLAKLHTGSSEYNKLNYELKLQQKRLAELTVQQMKYKAGIDASTSAYQKQSGVVKQLTGYFSGLYAAHTLVRFVRQVRDVTGALEYQRVALGHLLQDEAFGDELFAKTIEAAKESPFRIGQLVKYTKELAAYRIEQENLFDTTQRLADISAGLGVDMERLILAYGQVRAASVLRGQELRQFTEAGIPLVDLLADKFRKLGREGTTTADVFKLISERAVPFQYIKEIFEDLTNAGGMFYKMQETQAKTLQGRWEKLKDAYDQALMRVGESDTFQRMNDQVLSILNGMATNLNTVVRVVNAASLAWAAYWLTTKSGLSYGVRLTGMFVKEYGAVKTLTFGVAGLTAAFKKLWLAMKANWVGIAAGAITGIITLFTTFKNKTKETADQLSDMQMAIERLKNAVKDYNYGNKLIGEYKEIASNTERTSSQSERLAIAIEELKRLYPELADKIGNANVPLAEQLKLLDQAATKFKNLTIDEAKQRLTTQERIVKGYTDELKAAEADKNAAEARQRTFESESRMYEGKAKKQVEQFALDAAKAAKAAEEKYDEIAEKLLKAQKEANELRKIAFPETKADLTGWRKLLSDAKKYTSEGIPKEIFTEADINSWDSLGEAIKKLKPQYDEAKKTYEGLVSAVKEGGALVRPELIKDRDAAEDAFKAWQALDLLLGGLLSKNRTTGSDTRLSNLKKDIGEITNAYKKFVELRKYMSEQAALSEIGVLFPQLKGFEPTLKNTIERIQGLLKNYKGPKDKVYLEMQRAIDTEVSNLSFDDLKKTIEDKMKQVSDDIKRSEAAQNFYRNILEMTGDEGLATSLSVSVYGNVGDELKDRVKKQLEAAFDTFDTADYDLWDKMRVAVEKQDWNFILANLDKFGNGWDNIIKQMASETEKYNTDVAKSYAKLLLQFDEIEQQRVNISRKAAKEKKDIEEGLQLELKALREKGASEAEQQAARDRAALAQDAIDKQEKIDLSRLERDYRLFFSSVGVISVQAARRVASAQKKMLSDQFVQGQISLSKYKRELKEIDEQLGKYSGLDQFEKFMSGQWSELLVEHLKNVSDGLRALASTVKTENGLLNPDADTEKFLNKVNAILNFGNFAGIFSGEKKLNIVDEVNKAAKAAWDSAKKSGDSDEIADNKAAAAAKEILDKYAEKMGETSETFAAMANVLIAVLTALEKVGSGMRGIADQIERSGQYIDSDFGDFGDGLSNFFGAFLDIAKLDFSSAFSKFANLMGNVRFYDRQIKEQANSIKDLEYAYERLDVAIGKAFGSDYIENYNKQLEILEAKAEAYRKQAEAERAKGKAADEDTAKGYEQSAQELKDTIDEMQSQLSEFFTDMDLTSAANDFAQAWIDAYKEFGNTTEAMKEKFNEMIENMVVNSLAAQLIQGILKPVFDQIDKASKDGELSAQEIGMISAMLPERMQMINDSMGTLMNQLTTAGVNLRQQVGSFTGISRNIATASEESITGLAAGINTQNFYMQHIDMNVALILSAMTGGASTAGASVTGEVVDPYKDQMLLYAGHIPAMDQNLAELLAEVRKVIKPRGTTATHYVATNL